MCVCCGPAANGAGDAADVSHDDLYSDIVSVADSDVSFASTSKSTDSRFTRSTGLL